MPVLSETQTTFTVDGSKAVYLAVQDGRSVVVTNTGNTLYYKSTASVTSSSNDGNIATAASATFTTPQWLITAQGVSTSVFALGVEGWAGDLRVSDDLVVVDTTTQSGIISPSVGLAPISQPATVFSDPGTAPATATSGTDTAFANGTLFLTSVFVPANFSATGVGFLVGSVGGTDKVIVNVWTSAGVHVIGSTVASSGTTAGTAAQNQEIAFTAVTSLQGPRLYFIGVSANGATAKLRTRPAYTGGKAFSGSVAQTHAATTTVVAPSAFAADKAPFAYLY